MDVPYLVFDIPITPKVCEADSFHLRLTDFDGRRSSQGFKACGTQVVEGTMDLKEIQKKRKQHH